MATPDHLMLGPGVSIREVDGCLVAEKPGLRVRVRDRTSISILKRAAAGTADDPTSSGESDEPAEADETTGTAGANGTIAALVERGFLTPGHGLGPTTRPDRRNDYLVSLPGRHPADLIEGARQRLAAARVTLVGDRWLGGHIERALADSGVGTLTVSETEELPAARLRASSPPPDLLVDLTWPTAGTTEGGAGAETAVLPAVWTDDEIVVGPVLGGAAGRCRVCCGPSLRGRGWRDAPRADKLMGAGLVSAAALSYLSGLHPCDVLTQAVRYDLRTRQSESVPPRGNISCPSCGVPDLSAGEPPHPTAQVAWSYEESVDIPVTRASGTERWLSVRSQSVFRRRHFNMPPLRGMTPHGGAPVPAQLLSLVDLALRADPVTKQGKTTGIRYRRLPTVEGIGTTSVYLLPQKEHALLQGGAYYDPYAGELVPLRWPTGVAGQPVTRFSLCITGDFTGAEVCFGRFGRKAVLQDAGFLLAQLLHDGLRVGLRPVLSSSWSARHARCALDLAAGEEALTVIDYHLDYRLAPGDGAVPDPADQWGSRDPASSPGRPGIESGGSGIELGGPGIDSWLRPALDRVRQAAPPLLADLVLHRWSADEELREVRLDGGEYAGARRVQRAVADGDLLRDHLARRTSANEVTFLIGADLQVAVYRGGAARYSSLVRHAAAVAHYLAMLADETGLASRLLPKVPARLVEGSIAGGGAGHRVLSAVTVASPQGQVR